MELVETVMGLESKGVKETQREKCRNYGVVKSEIAALAFGRVLLGRVRARCVSRN